MPKTPTAIAAEPETRASPDVAGLCVLGRCYQRRRRVLGALAIAAMLVAVLVYRYGPGEMMFTIAPGPEPTIEPPGEPPTDHARPAPGRITAKSVAETPAPRDGVRPLQPPASQDPSPADRTAPRTRPAQTISARPTASTEPIGATAVEPPAESTDDVNSAGDISSIAATIPAGSTFQWKDAPVGGPMPARIREALERNDRESRKTQDPSGWSDAPVGGPMPARIRDALERKKKERNQ